MFKKGMLGIIALAVIIIFVTIGCKEPDDKPTPTVEYWSITWHLDGGSWSGGTLPAQVEKGTVLAKPTPDPAKSANTFGGWFTESGFVNEYNFTNAVTGNLNLHAKWIPDITYTVVQVGGTIDTVDSTGIQFTFSSSVDSYNLIADNISLSGAATKGTATFTGTGTVWTLSGITVNSQGEATVSISMTGIESQSKTFDIYRYIAPGNVSFNITLAQITDAAPNIDSGITLYLTNNDPDTRPQTATLTVENPEDYSSISWRVDDTEVTGTGTSFIISAANTAYNLACEHFVTVTVFKGGVPYNKTVSFFIEY